MCQDLQKLYVFFGFVCSEHVRRVALCTPVSSSLAFGISSLCPVCGLETNTNFQLLTVHCPLCVIGYAMSDSLLALRFVRIEPMKARDIVQT